MSVLQRSSVITCTTYNLVYSKMGLLRVRDTPTFRFNSANKHRSSVILRGMHACLHPWGPTVFKPHKRCKFRRENANRTLNSSTQSAWWPASQNCTQFVSFLKAHIEHVKRISFDQHHAPRPFEGEVGGQQKVQGTAIVCTVCLTIPHAISRFGSVVVVIV